MARFPNRIYYYLFAVLVVLAVCANALPAQDPTSAMMGKNMDDSVAGVKGLGAVFPEKKQQHAGGASNDMPDDMDDGFMDAAEPTPAQVQLSTHPTPGVVPTPVASNPKSTPTPVKQDDNGLSKLPLIGGLVKGLPLLSGGAGGLGGL
ncbi:hypothetical protein VTN77DRAFT_6020 [Rasamsonia byssochlamydoides]|uniref:uncharacterized protein n=1 Tax=Rasamsonia byssochlamydoides TaxID=89139 RepID=UPI003744917C